MITCCKPSVTPRSPNTYLVAYSYFLIVFFWFTSCICFVLWVIYMIVLPWIRIRELGVSRSLNREPDPRVLLDLVFLVFRFNQFQFQSVAWFGLSSIQIWPISVSNIIFQYFRFFMIFWNFLELNWKSSKPGSTNTADRFSDF